jgi:hypothetical protein
MLDGISSFERKRVKNLVNCSFHCSSALCRTPTLFGVPAQTVEKNIGRPLQMLYRDVSSTTFVSTVFVTQFNFLEKHAVKVTLTSWNTAQPRSRVPPERRRAAWRSCAARYALCRLGVRVVPVLTASRRESSVPFAPATSERESSPRSASRAVRPPRTAQRSVANSLLSTPTEAGAVLGS